MQLLADACRRQPGRFTQVPVHGQRVAPALRRPVTLGQHCNAAGDAQHLVHARHGFRGRFVEGLGFRTGQRRARHHRDPQADELRIDAVERLSVHLLCRIETLDGLAQQPELTALLEPGVGRHGLPGRSSGQGAVTQLAAVGRHDLAAFGAQSLDAQLPLRRRGRYQHLARCRARLAQRLPIAARAAAAACGLRAQHRVVVARVGRCLHHADQVPVGVQFLGQQHGQGRVNALPHFSRRTHDGDAVVGCNVQRGIGGEAGRLRPGFGLAPGDAGRTRWQVEAEYQRSRTAAAQQASARGAGLAGLRHRHTPRTCRFAAASLMAARIWL